MRVPHASCIELNCIRAPDSLVENSFTGIATSPKLIVAAAIGRAMSVLV
jgi:hypothetical protein